MVMDRWVNGSLWVVLSLAIGCFDRRPLAADAGLPFRPAVALDAGWYEWPQPPVVGPDSGLGSDAAGADRWRSVQALPPLAVRPHDEAWLAIDRAPGSDFPALAYAGPDGLTYSTVLWQVGDDGGGAFAWHTELVIGPNDGQPAAAVALAHRIDGAPVIVAYRQPQRRLFEFTRVDGQWQRRRLAPEERSGLSAQLARGVAGMVASWGAEEAQRPPGLWVAFEGDGGWWPQPLVEAYGNRIGEHHHLAVQRTGEAVICAHDPAALRPVLWRASMGRDAELLWAGDAGTGGRWCRVTEEGRRILFTNAAGDRLVERRSGQTPRGIGAAGGPLGTVRVAGATVELVVLNGRLSTGGQDLGAAPDGRAPAVIDADDGFWLVEAGATPHEVILRRWQPLSP
jgi:hypothetical protein